MEVLIWAGAGVSLIGVATLIGCMWLAAKARREGLSGDDMRARLQRLVALNLGALLISAIGLMMVVVGVLLA